jgi:glycine cleavage system regulatory protein
VQSPTPHAGAYRNALGVKIDTASGTTRVAGAVFDADTIRVTQIDDSKLEAVPEGYILMLQNQDVPGVVGRVGTLLGENQINIAGLELGREHVGGKAISLFHVDEPVPDAVLESLRTQPHVVSATLLRL